MKLEIGYNSNFEVRYINLPADSLGNIRVLYLSDLHFTRFSGAMARRLVNEVQSLQPDVVLFGGDYVDSSSGLFHLEYLISSLNSFSNVYAIPGNHDHFFGLTKIKHIFIRHNVRWIEGQSHLFEIKGRLIQVDGNRPAEMMSAADIRILCLHQPTDPVLFSEKYQLVFAGHLHGCQFVFWKKQQALYPGRLFYKWNILQKQIKDCHYVISKGLGDTIPIRYNCSKDVVLVTI